MKIIGFLLVIFSWADLDYQFTWGSLGWLLLGIFLVGYEEILGRTEFIWKKNVK